MKIKFEDILGLWKITSWNSKICDPSISIDYKNPDYNVISIIKVWNKDNLISCLYDIAFSRDFSNQTELSNYLLLFEDRFKEGKNFDVQIFNHRIKKLIGSFGYNYSDYYSDNNIFYNSDRQKSTCKLEFLNNKTIKITETTENINLSDKVSSEYAIHEIGMIKVEDPTMFSICKNIKADQEQKERNKLSNFYKVEKGGDKTQLTQGEMLDLFMMEMKKVRKEKTKKWWEIWK